MFKNYLQPLLDSVKNEYPSMITLLEKWVNINSYSENMEGLEEMITSLQKEYTLLEGETKVIALPPRRSIDRQGNTIIKPLGKALHIQKYPDAPFRIFLGGHMDTVFPPSSPFQKGTRKTQDILNGPGAADMKGGLVILLKTLQALESSPYKGKIGWDVFINPDEEIGSPGSHSLFKSFAANNRVGLLFEPSFSDGALIKSRKGSTNLTLFVKGKSAHAGRDFFEGRNSIYALSEFIHEVSQLIDKEKGITINFGVFEGGQTPNSVPDAAFCRFNIRTWTPEDFVRVREKIDAIVENWNRKDGFYFSLYEDTYAPPKPFDDKISFLFDLLEKAGQVVGVNIKTSSSGGVCDGSRLYGYGLPNIDTLGVVGGGLHTLEEYVFLPSLMERTQLALLFIFMLYDNYTQTT